MRLELFLVVGLVGLKAGISSRRRHGLTVGAIVNDHKDN